VDSNAFGRRSIGGADGHRHVMPLEQPPYMLGIKLARRKTSEKI
jgi:hypothetical protein